MKWNDTWLLVIKCMLENSKNSQTQYTVSLFQRGWSITPQVISKLCSTMVKHTVIPLEIEDSHTGNGKSNACICSFSHHLLPSLHLSWLNVLHLEILLTCMNENLTICPTYQHDTWHSRTFINPLKFVNECIHILINDMSHWLTNWVFIWFCIASLAFRSQSDSHRQDLNQHQIMCHCYLNVSVKPTDTWTISSVRHKTVPDSCQSWTNNLLLSIYPHPLRTWSNSRVCPSSDDKNSHYTMTQCFNSHCKDKHIVTTHP